VIAIRSIFCDLQIIHSNACRFSSVQYFKVYPNVVIDFDYVFGDTSRLMRNRLEEMTRISLQQQQAFVFFIYNNNNNFTLLLLFE
jgi:hypothetical protein